jgi:manganese/zinc/iron transport system permease protein
MGAAISATAPALPTGPIIVLVAFVLFMISLVFAPARGLISGVLRHRRFQARVHLRQGLLALAQHQPIYERLTHRLLLRADLIRPDGVPTDSGRARAAKALRDEKRWEAVRSYEAYGQAANLYDGLTEIENVLTSDQIAEIDDLIGPPRPVIP